MALATHESETRRHAFAGRNPVVGGADPTSAGVLGGPVGRNRSTSPWAALLAGWGILRVLALIPVAGALVGLAAMVVGLGALAVARYGELAGSARPRRGLTRPLRAVPAPAA